MSTAVRIALVLLAMAFFGNVYEALVFVPFLTSLPPGSLQVGISLGSPPLYFAPPAAVLIVLLLVLAWRTRQIPAARRDTLLATGCFAAALLSTVIAVLAVLVPGFTDPAVTEFGGTVLVWELLNALRLVLYLVAAFALLRVDRAVSAGLLSRSAPEARV